MSNNLVLRRLPGCQTIPPSACRAVLVVSVDPAWFVAGRQCRPGLQLVIVYDQRLPAFDDRTPFVVATVELDDAAGVSAHQSSECAHRRGWIGMKVQVVFEEIAPGICLPQFDASGPDLP